MGKEGYALRYELAKMTGRTSVPAVFVGGEFVGGCNDGGLGGVMTLESQGKLKGMRRPLVHDQCTWPAAGTPSDGARPSRCPARGSLRRCQTPVRPPHAFALVAHRLTSAGAL